MEKYEEALERAKQGLPIDEIFPELKESEDERTRKEIVKFIKDNTLTYTQSGCEIQKRWIDYLEKQEHTATEAYNKGFADGTVAERESEELERQKEKTGKKWIYEDDYKSQLDAQYQQGLEDGRKEQKPAEWSEHQHKLLNYAISMTEDAEVKNFLESLRNTSPKMEWSEEDEKNWNEYIERLKAEYSKTPNVVLWDDINWLEALHKRLKSIHPQPHWKPSEEQMKVLDIAIRCGIQLGTWEEDVLRSLFDDLKNYSYE